MDNIIKLTNNDIERYRIEIENIDISDKNKILADSVTKIASLLENKKLGEFELILLQEVNALHNILNSTPNLEESVQKKIIFSLRYFLKGSDDIPDKIPAIGYLDDLIVIDWIIKEIKDQYSKYFKA